MKTIKRIIEVILGICTLAGVVAFIAERFEKSSSAHVPYGVYEKYVKRPLDAFLSTGAIIALSPVMGVTALLVKKRLGSPVIYKAKRPGKIDGKSGEEKTFMLYKFRSMTNETDENGKLLPDTQRLTKFGRRLRSTSIDELPELLNIFKGDMSIVGPRPLAFSYLPYYTEEEHHRHDVRPGLTGLAQVNGRNNLTWNEKFAYDLEYVKRVTFLTDCEIILKTIKSVLSHEGIGQGEDAPGSFRVYRQEQRKIDEKNCACASADS